MESWWKMKVRVRIDRLILDGLPVSRLQGPMVQAAVEAELARMIGAGGISPELHAAGAVSSVSANSIQFVPGIKPSCLGRQIAKSVYGGIGR
jgi:hypothetical protein